MFTQGLPKLPLALRKDDVSGSGSSLHNMCTDAPTVRIVPCRYSAHAQRQDKRLPDSRRFHCYAKELGLSDPSNETDAQFLANG
jgi:hypothetical protein